MDLDVEAMDLASEVVVDELVVGGVDSEPPWERERELRRFNLGFGGHAGK